MQQRLGGDSAGAAVDLSSAAGRRDGGKIGGGFSRVRRRRRGRMATWVAVVRARRRWAQRRRRYETVASSGLSLPSLFPSTEILARDFLDLSHVAWGGHIKHPSFIHFIAKNHLYDILSSLPYIGERKRRVALRAIP